MGAAPGVEADRHARPYRRAGSRQPLHVEVRRRFPTQGRIGTSLPILRPPSRANGEGARQVGSPRPRSALVAGGPARGRTPGGLALLPVAVLLPVLGPTGARGRCTR